MARKKLLSCALAAILTVSTIWNSSPTISEAFATEAVAAAQMEEGQSASSANDSEETQITKDSTQVNAGDYGLCENTKDGAILHAWCWSFNTIKANLKDIAEAGFTTVQTSPANECLKGENGGMSIWSENGQGKWEYHYQPTDWKIGNYQLGTREEFTAMCEEADKYGVKIIVDVLPNHTTPQLGAVSQSLKDAAGGQDKLYHGAGFNSIGDDQWEQRYYCTNGAVLGLPDVNTENPGFQKYYLNYLNDLIDCGVDGFRYDTAKHIGLPDDPQDEKTKQNGWKNNFWPVAIGNESVDGVSLHNKDKMFIYGEVLQSAGSRDGDYGKIIHLTGSGYGGKLRDAVGKKDFGTGTISNWEHATPNKIVTWVESHDTYCNKHESGWLSDWDIRMCWAIIAARGSGTPLFYSRPDGSNGSQGNYWGNNKIGAKGNDQFKDPEVMACNHFRNAMVGESEYLSNSGGNDCLVIERGTKGAVIINMGSQKSNIKLNKMADGTYTEEVSGKEVQVSGGTLNYEVPAGKIAVVYNVQPISKSPKVSASKASGTFSEPFELTLTPSNATKATYSIDGGDTKEFTSKTTIKIGEGCSIGDKVTVKVTAEGEGDPFSETFTYTMAEVPEAKFLVRVKKSDFTEAPYIYAFSGDTTPATEYAGKWPGAKMEADGDYFVFQSDEVESATVILHDGKEGGFRNTQEGETEVVVTGMMEYDKGSNKFTTVTMPTKKPTPTPKEPDKPTPTPKQTDEPTPTPTKATATPDIVEELGVSSSLKDGSSFTSETQEITLTLTGNATSGTYSVDDGPEKKFNKSAKVVIGQGKIADSDITVKTTITDGKTTNKTTFTYKKKFDPNNAATVKKSAVKMLNSMFAVIKDAVQTNAGGAPQTDYYATNPGGNVGSKKTIKSASDFTEDMIIAQGVANDDPAAFRGTHEAPKFDLYAMYGAWDDENLYIGIQYTNVMDVVDPAQDAPKQDRGKPYSEDADIPQMLVFDTRTGDYTDGTANDPKGHKTAWNIDVKYDGETKVDKLFLYSPKKSIVNQALFSVKDGIVDYLSAVESGYNISSIEGVAITWEDGFFGSKMNGIKANGYEGYTPEDLNSTSSNWVDFTTTDHDTKYDTFGIVTLPLSLLGVSASDIESNGIGVMAIASYGASGMGCLPMDMTMLDNALESFGGGDPSTSHEKDDSDLVTVPLAQLGKSGGSIANKPTPTPKEDDKATPTPTPKEDDKPTPTPKEDDKATPTPKPSDEPSKDDNTYTVNFGADRSSPQYDSTELTLKAIGYGGKGDYTYEFSVDGKVVQENAKTDTYAWKPTKGDHTIKVVMKDANGDKVTSEKNYTIEEDTNTDVKPTDIPTVTGTPTVTETPIVTGTPTVTETPIVTGTPTVTGTPNPGDTKPLAAKLSVSKKSPQKAGTNVKISLKASGGTAPYQYTIYVENSAGTIKKLLSGSKTKTSATWKAVKAGTYKIYGWVEDAEGNEVAAKKISYKVKAKAAAPLKLKSFKVNKTKAKIKTKIKISASATTGKGTIKYQYTVTCSKLKYKKTRKYSKTKNYSFIPKKPGKYVVKLYVKDGRKTITKKKTITIRK